MITAALPTYNNSDIIWLQLESLCRQENAPEWELIVCEEESDKYLGFDGLAEYTERLKAANCQKITYLKLSCWIPLGQKWIEIRNNMHPDSVGMMLCASDNFSAPDRIAKTYEAMKQGAEWSQWNKGVFYNILSHEAGLFSIEGNNPALFMCISKARLDMVKAISFPRKGVDTWLLRSSGAKVTNLGHAKGIHTDGFNTISHKRRCLYSGESSGLFTLADANEVFRAFPLDIQEQLKKMRDGVN